MSRHFAAKRPTVGHLLPHQVFGRLVGQFQFASHIPLRGGQDTGRHLYLALKVPAGPVAGVFECAVNIRSDEDTIVQYAQRIEDLGAGGPPAFGFQSGVNLAYGKGTGDDFMGLADGDFQPIVNDALYNQIAGLAQNCVAVTAYGVTYTGGDGIHDIHMNSGTSPSDPHAGQDRVHQDGAIAFTIAMESGGQSKSFTHWVFIKFQSQHVVNS